eukprot:CAMPEP_0173250454 /NCGR_PEP_ID=MMETSP1142-20121109/19588_1 /TAXON_ID=483371 /ORGANISM="non described non described, Strain CCMP2298" /LENGTH=340 /DNA_ID=CAMNT_0014183203 /DNA_START=25 /DNA_END=1044 /DNA_ORIENTATION=+
MEEKDNKSRYRGVYRCGKRWKAQLQSHGVQFYLGMFDTEEEAALAYDRKAREEKGGKTLTNFDSETEEPPGFRMNTSRAGYYDEQAEDSRKDKHTYRETELDKEYAQKKLRRLDYQSSTQNMAVLWDRFCQVSQRLMLAKAAQAKLSEFHLAAPTDEKEKLLKTLGEEIVLLVIVKTQLEEALSRCFLLGLKVNVAPPAPQTLPQPNDISFGMVEAVRQQQAMAAGVMPIKLPTINEHLPRMHDSSPHPHDPLNPQHPQNPHPQSSGDADAMGATSAGMGAGKSGTLGAPAGAPGPGSAAAIAAAIAAVSAFTPSAALVSVSALSPDLAAPAPLKQKDSV